jgi:PAS domain S-box-containing protein
VRHPRFRSIRFYLLLLVLISLLPALALVLYADLDRLHDDVEEAKTEASKMILSLGYDHDRAVESTRQVLMTLAKLPDVQNRNGPACTRLFAGLLKESPLYTNIFAADSQGRVFASVLRHDHLTIRDRKYFRDILQTGTFSVGEYIIGAMSGRLVLTFAYPVIDHGGRLSGVVVAGLDLERYGRMFTDTRLPEDSVLAIFDRRNICLYRSREAEAYVGKAPSPDVIARMTALPPQGTFTGAGPHGTARLYVYKRFYLGKDPSPYLSMYVGISERRALSDARAAMLRSLGLLGSVLVIALMSAWFLGHRLIGRRLKALVDASRRLGQGDLTARTGSPHKDDELGYVTRAFDDMAEKIGHRDAYARLAEDVLRESEKRYRELTDSLPRTVAEFDEVGNLTFANRAGFETFGYTRADFDRGLNVLQLITPDEHLLAVESIRRAVNGEKVDPIEFTGVRKDGTTFPFIIYHTIFRFSDGSLGIRGIVIDLTDRKKAEDELQKVVALVRNSREFISLATLEGHMIFINDAGARMLGIEPEEVGSLHVPEILPDAMKDRLRNEIMPMLMARGAWEGDLQVNDLKTGKVTDLYTSMFVISDPATGAPLYLANVSMDVTERKQAEEALKRAEEKYHNIFENSVEGFLQATPDGRFLSANPSLARMYGYESPEALMAGVSDIENQLYVDPEARQRFRKTLEQQDFIENYEAERYRRDGTRIWTSANARIVRDSEGKVLYYEGTLQDITGRKRAEEALRVAHRQLVDIIEFFPDATLVIDSHGKVIAWNKAMEKLTGVKKEEMLGKGNYAYAIPFYGERQPIAIDLALGADPRAYRNYKYMRREGQLLWGEAYVPMTNREKPSYLSTAVCALVDGEGNVVGAVESIRDLTEQKRIEQELRESEERYRTAIESSNDGIVLLKDQNHLYVNRKYLQMFGFVSPDQVLGRSLAIVAHADDRERVLRINRGRQQKEKMPERYEFKGLRTDGDVVFVEVSATETTYQGESVTLACLRDITERKSLESQLLHAQKMEAIGTLAAGVAHDFNNILMTIMGYANLLEIKMDQSDPLMPYVGQILASTGKAANLTQSLLTFGRKQAIELKPHGITTLVGDAEKLLRRLLPEDIKLTIILDSDVTVMADITQIDQVLMNLATNARDAMPKGGELRIETARVMIDRDFKRLHGYGEPGEYASISVADTGTGMDEKTRQKIFEPFFTTKEVGKGTGLGLSIVFGIVKQHGGYITVYGEPGRGTVFHIYLPSVKAEVSETRQAPIDMRGGCETILFAEDNPDIRRMASDILGTSGYTVIEASDGGDALVKFREHHDSIDILILDVVMPVKNGKEAYEEIRAMKRDMKAIFMSGYTRDVIMDKGICDGAVDYVPKPIFPNELLRKVREVLDRPA